MKKTKILLALLKILSLIVFLVNYSRKLINSAWEQDIENKINSSNIILLESINLESKLLYVWSYKGLNSMGDEYSRIRISIVDSLSNLDFNSAFFFSNNITSLNWIDSTLYISLSDSNFNINTKPDWLNLKVSLEGSFEDRIYYNLLYE